MHMQINWKIAVPFAIVLAALFAALMGMGGKKAPTDVVSTPETELVQVAEPGLPATKSTGEVSGNVDDLTLSLVGEADQDLTFAGDADEDMALVTSDSASINGYATAYDETTF